MEIALAERLGVSRTPIREAMRKLELEGLVVMIPRRGAQVANITEKDLNDVLEVRIVLENMAIEKACARMTEEDIEKEEETRNLLVKEHEEITQAIRERNVGQARELSYQHLENQRKGIISSIQTEE